MDTYDSYLEELLNYLASGASVTEYENYLSKLDTFIVNKINDRVEINHKYLEAFSSDSVTESNPQNHNTNSNEKLTNIRRNSFNNDSILNNK